MKRLLLVATILLAAGPALSDPAEQQAKAAATENLTIVQLINIADALRQLGDYRDRAGQLVKVPFKFDGGTLLTFAIDIRAADDAQKVYQEAYARFEAQQLETVKLEAALVKSPGETDEQFKARELQQKKIQISNSDGARHMVEQPAKQLLARIKWPELCVDTKVVPPCTQKNDIPPSLLAALMPLIDR